MGGRGVTLHVEMRDQYKILNDFFHLISVKGIIIVYLLHLYSLKLDSKEFWICLRTLNYTCTCISLVF